MLPHRPLRELPPNLTRDPDAGIQRAPPTESAAIADVRVQRRRIAGEPDTRLPTTSALGARTPAASRSRRGRRSQGGHGALTRGGPRAEMPHRHIRQRAADRRSEAGEPDDLVVRDLPAVRVPVVPVLLHRDEPLRAIERQLLLRTLHYSARAQPAPSISVAGSGKHR
jgi:hypothetical protein